MVTQRYQDRLKRCSRLMKEAGLDALLLTKPANMYYLTGDGRLCAYAMITQEGKVTLGVPSTDVDDVTLLAHFDHIAGFENEVGMLTHPHAKPACVTVKDCTHVMVQLRIVKLVEMRSEFGFRGGE